MEPAGTKARFLGRPSKLSLRVGELEKIRLPGLGTVGYDWDVSVEGAPEAVTVEHSTATDEPPGPPGQSVDHVFTLKGLEPGRATVHFEQRRPWEREAPPRDSHDVEVEVTS